MGTDLVDVLHWTTPWVQQYGANSEVNIVAFLKARDGYFNLKNEVFSSFWSFIR